MKWHKSVKKRIKRRKNKRKKSPRHTENTQRNLRRNRSIFQTALRHSSWAAQSARRLLRFRPICKGVSEKDAGAFVTITLVMLAQLLTGLGVFDVIAKFAGAGVIVPITGFSNSMVAPALEYKREGPVLGVGAKLFSVAGPVLVCGISAATIVGIIYWLM